MLRLLMFQVLFACFGICHAAGYVDTVPSGTGGCGETVEAPLADLIQRLTLDWTICETGKAYWIGYTADMYSIARHRERAVEPLVRFIQSNPQSHAQYGAILTLHLIGIRSRVAGRFYESFQETKARKALLQLARDPRWQETVVRLLRRHPWKSDMAELMDILRNSKLDNWVLLNSLYRYCMRDIPFRQMVPKPLVGKKVRFPGKKGWRRQAVTQTLFPALKEALGDKFLFDPLFEARGYSGEYLNLPNSSAGQALPLYEFLYETFILDRVWAYVNDGPRMHYYFENGALVVVSAETAKKRWLKWYQANKHKLSFDCAASKPVPPHELSPSKKDSNNKGGLF